jgi:hypothetical protein
MVTFSVWMHLDRIMHARLQAAEVHVNSLLDVLRSAGYFLNRRSTASTGLNHRPLMATF